MAPRSLLPPWRNLSLLGALLLSLHTACLAEDACGYSASFSNNSRGWTLQKPPVYGPVNGGTSSEGLWLSPSGQAPGFAYWISPNLSVSPGAFLTISWTVRSNTDRERVPQFRLRVNETNFRNASFMTYESNAGGWESPHHGTLNYTMMYRVPQSASEIVLAFDLLSFDPGDDLQSRVTLERVSVVCGGTPQPTQAPTPTPQPTNVVYNSATGTYYEAVIGQFTWQQAKASAESRYHNGRRGRLATPSTFSENQWILYNVNFHGRNHFWLGATQSITATGSTDGWSWQHFGSTQSFGFTNWGPGEPNGGFEDFLAFWVGGGGVWFDALYDTTIVEGYVVEYIRQTKEATLPEGP